MNTALAGFLWAGFIATTLGTAAFWLVRAQGITRLSPTRHLGGFVFRDPYRPQTDALGIVMLYAAGTLLLPPLYEAILVQAGWASWRGGALLGLFVGIILAALLPITSRAVRAIRSGLMPEPGNLGLGWGWGTPLAIVLAHVVYGGVLLAVLTALT